MTDSPTRPTGLNASGRKLWDGVLAEFEELDPDQLRVLEDAARLADSIARLDRLAAKADPLTRPGLAILAEARISRATLERHLRGLKLRDDSRSLSEKRRAAVRSRWDRQASGLRSVSGRG